MVKSKKCYIALLLFSTMFLGLFVNSSGDVSAVSDYTLTFDSNSSYNQNIRIDISSYNYVYISATGSFPSTSDSYPSKRRIFSFTNGAYSSDYLYPASMQVKLLHCSDVPNYIYCDSLAFSSINFSLIPPNETVTFILSESPVIGSSSPSGTLSISENGTFNVSSYEYAEVDVPAPPVVTPYDGKLDSLIQAVYTVGAVLLVIYFFFALYRLYIGGKT